MLAMDEALLADVRARLADHPGLRFVLGGAGTGKSTVCAAIADRNPVRLIEVDARLYGSWHGVFDARRHPACHAWSSAADPLAWLVALDPDAFLAWHAASTVEALDLLAVELGAVESDGRDAAILVDGGFGSSAVLARAIPPRHIAVLSLAPAPGGDVWTSSPDRRAFLDVVAGVRGIADPVARFLALDRALSDRIVADAASAGMRIFQRLADTSVAALADAVAAHLGIVGRD